MTLQPKAKAIAVRRRTGLVCQQRRKATVCLLVVPPGLSVRSYRPLETLEVNNLGFCKFQMKHYLSFTIWEETAWGI